MKRLEPEVIDYYDSEVVTMMVTKYGMGYMEALKSFVNSETHRMLENSDGAGALFDMWECEKIAGDPRKSIYIRGE